MIQYLNTVAMNSAFVFFLPPRKGAVYYFLNQKNESQKNSQNNAKNQTKTIKKKVKKSLNIAPAKSSADLIKEQKLKKLGNINKKLDYFNMKFLDRYLAYKTKNPQMPNEQIVLNVNMGLDVGFYNNTEPSGKLNTRLVIANKHYFLGEGFVPAGLVAISADCSTGSQLMAQEAASSFEKMCRDAKLAGMNIRAMSAYRSADTQRALYNNYAAASGVASADTYSARPGFSEHQTGYATDIDDDDSSYTQFKSTKEYVWMKQNAHKYGFIQRYQAGKEYITGYVCEEWHWRYVGADVAGEIVRTGLTYDEHYEIYVKGKR